MAPAHPHATGVAVYQALFFTKVTQLNRSRGCQENWISFPRKALKSEFFFSISPLTTQCTPNIGSVPIRDSRVFNKPLGRSLHSFTRTAHSAHLLSSIRLASSTGWLTHFDHSLCSLCSLTSLPHGMVEIHKCPDLYLILFISRKAVFSHRHATTPSCVGR